MTLEGDPLGEARPWLEQMPERVVVCTAEGRIVWASALAAFLFGRPRAELEGRALQELVLDREPGPSLLRRLHARPHGEGIEGILLHGSGTHIRVELASSGFVGDLAVVVIRATPQREHADAGARTYELVFEGAPVGIFHFDAQGAVTACNDAFVGILGSPRRVLLGVRMDTLPDPVMRRCILDTLAGVRAHYQGESRSATSGQVRSVRVTFAPILDGAGVVIGGVGIAEDVTERERAELAWQRSVESFRALIERAPDAIAVHRGHRFLLVNPMLVKLLGHTGEDELFRRPVEDVLHPDEEETARMWTAEALAPTDLVLRREVRLRSANGDVLTVEIASITIDYEGGPAFLSFARDVTKRRADEARLAVADRLASVGTLAAGIGHEINNPLAYVLLNLDLLKRDTELRPASRTAVERAREGSERIRVIIRDLRIFSRIEEDRRVPIDVRDAISSALNLASSEIRARARLVRDTPPVPFVLGDEARLTQVILNLVLNAAQAIREGDPSEHTISVTTRVRDGWVEIGVTDTGEGIAPEVRARIFEPFWTTKPVGVGTGLGLSIVHGIVQALGGHIEVESEPHVGTRFHILLPAAAPDVATPSCVAAPPAITKRVRRARILVIDDERLFAEALEAGLRERHDVVIETAGHAGLVRLLGDEHFDLVLCDVMMPGVGGMEIFEAIRDRPELASRFALMTGGAYTDETRARVESLHVLVLAKPFELSEVDALLSEVVPDL